MFRYLFSLTKARLANNWRGMVVSGVSGVAAQGPALALLEEGAPSSARSPLQLQRMSYMPTLPSVLQGERVQPRAGVLWPSPASLLTPMSEWASTHALCPEETS